MTWQLLEILALSLAVSGSAVLLSSLVGIPLGVWLALCQFRGKRIVLGVLHTGMAMPPVVVGLCLYLLLSHSGPFGWLGWLFTPRAMVAAQTILDLPFIIGITIAAVSAVPAELKWELRSLGASPFQLHREILREARSGMLLAVSTAFGRSFSEVGAVWLVGGNIEGQTRLLTTAILLETGKGNFAFAISLGSLLLAMALAINLMIIRSQARFVS